MLDASFWELDYTPLLPKREAGRLYLEVKMRRDAKHWPAFWGAEQIWDLPAFQGLNVDYIARDRWDRGVKHNLIKVVANVFPQEPLTHTVEPGGPCVWGLGESEFKIDDIQYRRTEATEADLMWIFSHWRPDHPRRRGGRLADWWAINARKTIHPEDLAKAERAFQRVTTGKRDATA